MKRGRLAVALVILACAAVLPGCASSPDPEKAAPQPYIDQGYKADLPRFMHGTVFERTDIGNTDPYAISGYSLVVNLQQSGNNSGIPTAVREAMIKRMALSGFGQHDDPRYTNLQPEDVLADNRVAIVRVIGMLPPGVRRGQKFDIAVQSMPRSRTTSLAHGHLYNTELRNRGLEQPSSGGTILAYADAGDVFVNPVYALEGTSRKYSGASPTQVSASLCSGIVLNSGRATEDRPILLQLRVPQASIARRIESRINTRFPAGQQDRPAASAEDEGLIYLYVPLSFNGDWHHFVELVNHIYLNDTPDFSAQKARQLMAEAHKPAAALTDISFCLEALGPSIVPLYQSMLSDPDPAVAYAAARAAVFCGDAGALEALTQMAIDPNHPYQLGAVHTLGELAPSPAVDKRLEPLLGSDQALVRIEAYKILAAHGDRRIVTESVPGGFKIDMVDYPGSPLIYAARSGEPRIALFGNTPSLSPPVVFAAVQDRLTISSDELGKTVTIFYRDPAHVKAIRVQSRLTMSELIARLGGVGPAGEAQLDFSYADVVAIVQSLSEEHVVVATNAQSQAELTPFVLDEPRELTDALLAAALDARPQADPVPKAGAAAEANPAVPTFGGAPAGADSGAGSGAAAKGVPSFGGP